MIQEVENENGEKTYENVTDAIDIATGHNHTVVLNQMEQYGQQETTDMDN